MSAYSFRTCLLRASVAMVACVSIASAQQERSSLGQEHRVALVIGNADYKNGKLANPVNDARAMAARLQTLGFDVVLRENLLTRDIGGVYREFRSKITPGSVALVFYAGHGVQIKGQNYFPTVDSNIDSEEDVPLQSLNLGTLLDNMEEAKAGVSLVFLDACRDNPFARRFRTNARGLAKVEASSGTLIHYATKPGSVADDGQGKNGTYTTELLAQMSEPGIPVELMLKQVANRVAAKTKGKQEPWMEGSLRGDFYFIFTGPTTVNVQQTPSRAGDVRRFDGYWDFTLDCSPYLKGAGYVRKFLVAISDGGLSGSDGVQGQSDSIRIQGQVQPDGSAFIEAKGLTGLPKFSVDGSAAGTAYAFQGTVRFDGARGVGRRDNRPCDLMFAKR